MQKSHANKSISFLMELIFVLFFFTLASAVCVLVLGAAKDKNNTAADMRNALQYGENLLAQREEIAVQQALQRKTLYLDETGNPVDQQEGYYRVVVEQKAAIEKSGKARCELCIYRGDKELARLPFLLEGGVQE